MLFDGLKTQWLGRVSYERALMEQRHCYDSQSGILFLGFETLSPTITLGRNASEASEVLSLDNSFEIIKTDRGGQATLHNPGQLVIFPVIDLDRVSLGPRQLVCELLWLMTHMLTSFHVNGLITADDGLYTGTGKLGFVGLRIKDKKVYHGLAINVCNDLAEFDFIRSCGKDNATHDRVANHFTNIQVKQVFEALV